MKVHRWGGVPLEQMNAQIARQVIHTETMTIARLTLKKGAIVPRHSHPNEQVSNLESGRLRFVFDDADLMAEAGDSVQIPGGVPHLVEALEDSVALDLFSPPREDWIRGEDAYLRR
jgi:quercetin dioxygenase-like cupin family protein